MYICAAMIGVHILNWLVGAPIQSLGIMPRDLFTIWHIVTAPFIHGDIIHLVNNIIGLCIFSALILVHSIKRYVFSSVFIIITTGLLIWLFGRSAIHIGASGWIFGLWALCIANAWYERLFINIVIALFVIIFYGGMIYGVMPGDPRISFESHLFGALMGWLFAFLNAHRSLPFTNKRL